jgi:hypothetical protein
MRIRLIITAYEDPDPFDDTEQDHLIPNSHIDGYSGLEAFVHVLEGATNLFWNKNRLYGDAWRSQGYMGNLARIMSKVSRLKNMLWGDEEMNDAKEPVEDTFYDMINLSVFSLLNRGQGNRWGNDRQSD